MSEETTTGETQGMQIGAAGAPGAGGAGQQQVQLLLDEREMRTTFANAYRIHHTAEEVVLDFGFNMANPNPQGGQPQQLLFKVTDRVIMSYPSVKRLTISLQQLVRRYEQQFGEIATQPGQRPPAAR
jgi:hypothetical protein